MKKKIALLLSVAMLTASLAGCGGKSGSTSAPAGDSGSATTEAGGTAAGGHKDTLVIGTDADINNLDLQQQQDQINNIILKNTLIRPWYFSTMVPREMSVSVLAWQPPGSSRMTPISR